MRKSKKRVKIDTLLTHKPTLVISNDMVGEIKGHLDELISKHKVPTSKILVLCPTGLDKRNDLEEIRDCLKSYSGAAIMDSFHSLGYCIMKFYNHEALNINVGPFVKYQGCRMRDFKIELLKRGIHLNNQQINNTLQRIESAKSHLIYPEETRRENNFIQLYKIYQQSLGDDYDYDDLVARSYFLLENNPWLLKHFRQLYRYIVVCDYQDLTWAQHKLLHILTGGGNEISLWVVGSDDMKIGEFRRPRSDGLKRFSEEYPGAIMQISEGIGGQHPCIAWAAWRIVSKIPGRLAMESFQLPSAEECDSRITVCAAKDPVEETALVAGRIVELLQQGISPEDIGVVYWDSGAGKRMTNALAKLKIKYRKEQKPIYKCKVIGFHGNSVDEVNNEKDISWIPGDIITELIPSIAILKWHKARGFMVKHLFVIAMDEDVCINFDSLPLDEQALERRKIFTVLKCAKEFLHLSCAMKRMAHGKWRSRRRSVLIDEITLSKKGNQNVNTNNSTKEHITSRYGQSVSVCCIEDLIDILLVAQSQDMNLVNKKLMDIVNNNDLSPNDLEQLIDYLSTQGIEKAYIDTLFNNRLNDSYHNDMNYKRKEMFYNSQAKYGYDKAQVISSLNIRDKIMGYKF